jgi:hexosaminidase
LDSVHFKFNVFHWHVSDDNSWPLGSKTYPNFAAKASFSAAEVYSPADLALVVQHARERGILVVLEWDMPAHARSWGLGYPATCTSYPWGQPGGLA